MPLLDQMQSFLQRVGRIAALVSLAASAGCQSFAPADLARARDDKRTLKQAESDPFPSPADVGLDAPESAP